jgi:hypothetical protein
MMDFQEIVLPEIGSPHPDEGMVATAYPRLAFVHVPKTAGTAVTNALNRAYAGGIFPAMTTIDYRHYDNDSFMEYRFFKGHAYRCDYERLPAGTILLTILRDPVARTMSLYQYYRAILDTHLTDPFMLEASHLAKTASIVEFIYSDSPFLIEHLRLGQVRQFLPDDMLKQIAHRQFLSRELRHCAVEAFTQQMARFDYSLTTEALALSFPLMAAQLGLPESCLKLERDNESEPAADIDPADIRRALIDVNAAEFTCYDNVRRRETAWLVTSLRQVPSDPLAWAHMAGMA